MRAPICIPPLSIRCAPNHITATLETFTTNITLGNMKAIIRPTRSETSVSSWLAPPKRRCSWPSFTKARITRMPVICSRRTRLTVSILVCMERNSGRSRRTSTVTTAPSTGTTTSSSADSGTSWLRAMITPPKHMIGAATIRVKLISTSIWTCWTSLVVRVISDGAPNWPSSRAEKLCTRSKTEARMSRPTAIAVRAP